MQAAHAVRSHHQVEQRRFAAATAAAHNGGFMHGHHYSAGGASSSTGRIPISLEVGGKKAVILIIPNSKIFY